MKEKNKNIGEKVAPDTMVIAGIIKGIKEGRKHTKINKHKNKQIQHTPVDPCYLGSTGAIFSYLAK
jgi:hypothetical protein